MIALMAAEMIMIIQMLAVKTVATGVRLWCQWSWCETVHCGMERKLCHGLRVLLSSRWNVVAVDVCYIGCFPCPVMAHGLVHVIPIVANNSCCKGIYSFIQSIEWLSLFFLPSLLGFLFTHLPSWTSDDGTSSDIEYISLWRDGWMNEWMNSLCQPSGQWSDQPSGKLSTQPSAQPIMHRPTSHLCFFWAALQ